MTLTFLLVQSSSPKQAVTFNGVKIWVAMILETVRPALKTELSSSYVVAS